jgi:hypothetical protein
MSSAAERLAWELYYRDNPGTSKPFASEDGVIRSMYLAAGKDILRAALTMNQDELDEHVGDLMAEWHMDPTDENGYDEAVKTVRIVVDSLLEKIVR